MDVHDLPGAADRLARAAPAEWRDFLVEYEKYLNELQSSFIAASADTVLTMQGRVREALGTLRLLAERRTRRPEPTQKPTGDRPFA